jgi:Type II secretion system (T2SS), protein G
MSKPFKIVAGGLGSFLLVALVATATFFIVDRPSRRALTASRMITISYRIFGFARRNDRLPATLSELPPREGYDNKTNDDWGRDLDYSFDEAGAVTLGSLGADHQPGGDGDNRDLTGVFASRDEKGQWQDPASAWIQRPKP